MSYRLYEQALNIFESEDCKADDIKYKLVFLGSLYGKGTSFAGAVWDKKHLSPTIMTCQGGGREPHIIVKVKIDDK